MARFKTSGRTDASPQLGVGGLARRGLLAGAGALMATACQRQAPLTASTTPGLDMKRLNAAAREIQVRLTPGILGAALMNLDSVETWTFAGDRPFPMEGVSKAPIGAAVLAEVDAGALSLDEAFTLEEMDLSPPWSPVADGWPGRRSWTGRELLAAAVSEGDNTASDLLMRRIGGPGAVSAWLAGKRIEEVRVDRYEREIQPESVGLTPFRPAWRGEAAWLAAMAQAPAGQRQAALERRLKDPRDSATPRGMIDFLQKLDSGQLLSPASTRTLLQLMRSTPGGRLAAGLPPGAKLAHRTGTARRTAGVAPAVNDAGLITLPDGRAYAAAVFVSGATAAQEVLDGAIAELTRAMVRAMR